MTGLAGGAGEQRKPRAGQERSPAQLAKELGEPLGRLSYHVRRLEDAGLISASRTAPVRGAIEHFYRPVARAERIVKAARQLAETIADQQR